MVNWDRISELRQEVGEDDLTEVLALFCEEVEEVLAVLPSAEQSTLKGHLHFLKGSAANIGLDAVCTLCREAEDELTADPQAPVQVEFIRETYNTARAELADLF